MKFVKTIFGTLLLAILSSGCGNSDSGVGLDKNQKAVLLNLLGSYKGEAHAERIMGAMMTGVWKVRFLEDGSGALKCKCTLQLHDEQSGWGSPTTATADVKLFRGASAGLYDLKAEASFSDSEPNWFVCVDGISLSSGQAINAITLFDMSSYEIKLQRQ